jgi:hypothetical protein
LIEIFIRFPSTLDFRQPLYNAIIVPAFPISGKATRRTADILPAPTHDSGPPTSVLAASNTGIASLTVVTRLNWPSLLANLMLEA